MRAILLGDTSVELYSTDLPPTKAVELVGEVCMASLSLVSDELACQVTWLLPWRCACPFSPHWLSSAAMRSSQAPFPKCGDRTAGLPRLPPTQVPSNYCEFLVHTSHSLFPLQDYTTKNCQCKIRDIACLCWYVTSMLQPCDQPSCAHAPHSSFALAMQPFALCPLPQRFPFTAAIAYAPPLLVRCKLCSPLHHFLNAPTTAAMS